MVLAPDVGITAIVAAKVTDIKPGSYTGTAASDGTYCWVSDFVDPVNGKQSTGDAVSLRLLNNHVVLPTKKANLLPF
jgi:hypothetical protein